MGKNAVIGNEIEKFCQEVSSYKNIYFMAYMTLNALSEQAIKILAKGHFIRLFVGAVAFYLILPYGKIGGPFILNLDAY